MIYTRTYIITRNTSHNVPSIPLSEPDSPPGNLTVEDSTSTTATLLWSPPERPNGVVQLYEVTYENEFHSASLNSSSNRVTLTNLRPFSYYNVSVRAYTRYGHGNQTSDILYLLSGEDGALLVKHTSKKKTTKKHLSSANGWCLFASPVPGSPPYGLAYESISPSEVNVTWRPPLLPNGIITHYSLELWNSSHYLNLTSQTNGIRIAHLRKYANYRLVVQAHTQAGPGNYSSEPLNITTLEDGERPESGFRGGSFFPFVFQLQRMATAQAVFPFLLFPTPFERLRINTGLTMLLHRSGCCRGGRARGTQVIPFSDWCCSPTGDFHFLDPDRTFARF